MEIPRSSLDRLTEELNALSGAGRQMVENALANAVWADVTELRAVMADVMELVCGEMTDLAAARSAEFYDDVRELCVGRRLGALADSGRKPAATEGAVRALIQSVVDTGTTELLSRDLGDRVDYEVKRAAGECVAANGARDPLDVRFARVPSGVETCPFCIMLASRGFVYRSESTAGMGHYHPNCDCRIVPGFKDTDVEDYDLNVLYDRYVAEVRDGRLKLKDVEKSSGGKASWKSKLFNNFGDFSRYIDGASDIEDLQARCAIAHKEWGRVQLSERYWSQLRTLVVRKRAEIADQKPPGLITFDERAEPMKKELDAGNLLAARGFDVRFRATRSREGKKTSDVYLNGEAWEMKQPQGSGKRSISNQFNEARGQSSKLVIDVSASPWEIGDIEREAKRQLDLRPEFEEVILIKSGYFKHIK